MKKEFLLNMYGENGQFFAAAIFTRLDDALNEREHRLQSQPGVWSMLGVEERLILDSTLELKQEIQRLKERIAQLETEATNCQVEDETPISFKQYRISEFSELLKDDEEEYRDSR